MAPPLFLQTIEDTGFSTWLRESESPFAFYFILLFHTFGLALLVGANLVVDLRLLGVARGIPLAPLKRVVPHHVDRLGDECRDRRFARLRLSDEVADELGFLHKIGDHRLSPYGSCRGSRAGYLKTRV